MQGLWSESESQGIYPDSCAYILHLQRISAATRAGLVIVEILVEMKEKTFRNILDIAKKLELRVGFEQQIKHSGSSERKKTKLDWTNLFILASLLVKI
jgi:hypothetical protein